MDRYLRAIRGFSLCDLHLTKAALCLDGLIDCFDSRAEPCSFANILFIIELARELCAEENETAEVNAITARLHAVEIAVILPAHLAEADLGSDDAKLLQSVEQAIIEGDFLLSDRCVFHHRIFSNDGENQENQKIGVLHHPC